MPTSNEILDTTIELLVSLENATTDEEKAVIGIDLSNAYLAMGEKADNYDDYLLTLDQHEASYKAQIAVFQAEIDRMKKKIKRFQNVRDRFFQFILPKAIEILGDGNEFSTERSTYKYAVKWSALTVENPKLLPKKYFVKQADKIDNRTLRSDAMKAHQNGTKIEGAHVTKERVVRKY